MAYLLLGSAVALEIFATTLLKYSEGFTRLCPTIGCMALYFICFFAFSKALNSIDLGIGYATWCAGGIVATSIISALIFGQRLTPIGIVSIVLIIIGCVLLNLFGSAGH